MTVTVQAVYALGKLAWQTAYLAASPPEERKKVGDVGASARAMWGLSGGGCTKVFEGKGRPCTRSWGNGITARRCAGRQDMPARGGGERVLALRQRIDKGMFVLGW